MAKGKAAKRAVREPKKIRVVESLEDFNEMTQHERYASIDEIAEGVMLLPYEVEAMLRDCYENGHIDCFWYRGKVYAKMLDSKKPAVRKTARMDVMYA